MGVNEKVFAIHLKLFPNQLFLMINDHCIVRKRGGVLSIIQKIKNQTYIFLSPMFSLAHQIMTDSGFLSPFPQL